jgi:hypothetical protein
MNEKLETIAKEISDRMKEIAMTIIDQIRCSDRMALMAWGASNYVSLCEGEIPEIGYILGGIQFNVRGAKVNRGGRVIVYLMGNDTYTVRVGRVYNGQWKDIKIVNEVYCDNLMEIIDNIIER